MTDPADAQARDQPGLGQVPLSALEHFDYCPRQAGLIILEDGYADDATTIRGTLLHHRVHEPGRVALAVRGERGSQLLLTGEKRVTQSGARRPRRARIATPPPCRKRSPGARWRSPSTASEDRNGLVMVGTQRDGWRSSRWVTLGTSSPLNLIEGLRDLQKPH